MSSVTGINAGFAGTGPYRIVSPTVEVDASGGTSLVSANSKFNTNLPLGFGMLITDIEWIVALQEGITPTLSTGNDIWQIIYQLTESLARTAVAQNDPIDVSIYFDELWQQAIQSTAVGVSTSLINRAKALERQHLNRPWLSVAQQLNLVGSTVPVEQTSQNGPESQAFVRIYFDIVTLTSQQQAYLAQRIQISGQA